MIALGKPVAASIPVVFDSPIAFAATPAVESAVASTPIDAFQLLSASPAVVAGATLAVAPAVFEVPVGVSQAVSGLPIFAAAIAADESVATPFGAPIAVVVASLADGLVVPAIAVVSQPAFGDPIAFVATAAPSVFDVLAAVADEHVPVAAAREVFEFPGFRLLPAARSEEQVVFPVFVAPGIEDFPVVHRRAIWINHLIVR